MQQEESQILEVCRRFGLTGEYKYYEVINSGHINSTYKVFFFRDGEMKDYIVQRVNTYVFQNPLDVMENIAQVTEYIRAKIKATGVTAKRSVLHYQQTGGGAYFAYLTDGSFWRCCRFIDGSMSFLAPESEKIIESSGRAFGEFQQYLSDYPVEKLCIVIPHFHNTVNRYELFRTAIEKNEAGRLDEVRAEIEGYFELEEIATKLYKMQKAKLLPLRVTHNDTKCSNVLFDEKTGEYLCVIDLDTVMPGLVAFDFGDAIRIAASTGAEDEKDLSIVAVDMKKYEAFTRGFVPAVKDVLTEREEKTLALGAVAMTVECGMRFLTDYLDGDKYFKIHYPDQNLVRARCHLTLAKDMIAKLDEMQAIVNRYCR
jgi:hypothetical protein